MIPKISKQAIIGKAMKLPATIIAISLAFMAHTNQSNAEAMRSYGLDLDMTAGEISTVLSSKGLTCTSFDQSDFPPDPAAKDVSTTHLMFCVDSPDPTRAASLTSRIEAIDSSMEKYSSRLFEEFEKIIEEPAVVNGIRNSLAVARDAANLYKVVVYHETKHRKTLLFSCGNFNSCTRPILEIRSQLASDVAHRRYEAILAKPPIITDIYQDVSKVSASDPTIGMAVAFTSVDTLNFEDSISGCFFLDDDRMCIYEGALRLDALNIMLSMGKMPRKPETVALLSDIQIPVRMFWMERDLLSSGSPSFQ